MYWLCSTRRLVYFQIFVAWKLEFVVSFYQNYHMSQGLSKEEIKAEIEHRDAAELVLLENYPSNLTELFDFYDTVL